MSEQEAENARHVLPFVDYLADKLLHPKLPPLQPTNIWWSRSRDDMFRKQLCLCRLRCYCLGEVGNTKHLCLSKGQMPVFDNVLQAVHRMPWFLHYFLLGEDGLRDRLGNIIAILYKCKIQTTSARRLIASREKLLLFHLFLFSLIVLFIWKIWAIICREKKACPIEEEYQLYIFIIFTPSDPWSGRLAN